MTKISKKDPNKQTFTTAEIAKICGIKFNRLSTWLNLGLVSASVQQASGHGTKNIFSILDLYEVMLFIKLTENGLQRDNASKLAKSVISTQFYTKGWISLGGESKSIYPDDLVNTWFLVFHHWEDGQREIESLIYFPNGTYDGELFKNSDRVNTLENFINSRFVLGYEIAMIIDLSSFLEGVDAKIKNL